MSAFEERGGDDDAAEEGDERTCGRVYVPLGMYACMYQCIYMYIYILTNIHTYTHCSNLSCIFV